jgi:hypothetical protein
MAKFTENSDDIKLRIFLDYNKKIIDSFNKGDYLTIADFDDDSDHDLPIIEEFLDLDSILSKKRLAALCHAKWHRYIEDLDDTILDFKFIRLYKVIEKNENGIPIVQRVKFPNEHGCNDSKYSLLSLFFVHIETYCDYRYSAPCIQYINEFAKLDSNYVDSIILESIYVPYEKEVAELHHIEVELDIIAKKQQKEKAIQARKEKEAEALAWKYEFERIVGNGLRKKYKEHND